MTVLRLTWPSGDRTDPIRQPWRAVGTSGGGETAADVTAAVLDALSGDLCPITRLAKRRQRWAP
jgi:hypothetical protein